MLLLRGFLVASLLVSAIPAQTDPTAVPAGAKPILTVLGDGVQIYTCKASAAGPEWTFTAPQARLLDHGKEIGTHDAGPTWTLKDGSSIKGQLLTSRPSPIADAIPWLLLKAAEVKGPGALARVEYVRRSDTVGGKARSAGCDLDHLGAIDRVPYKATYTFYSAAPRL